MLVPGSSTPLLAHSAAAAAGGVSRSIRLNAPDSAYLSRTPASAGNRKTWTWAGWVKRSKLGQNMPIFGTDYNGASYFTLYFTGGNNFAIENYNASYQLRIQTTQLFRDPSAWFHLVVALDTTQGTASDRCKIYVNGSQVTALDFNTYPSQNTDLLINNNQYHEISTTNSTYTFGGYLADIYFIDGAALTPSSFTETDATTGQLIPKAFSGSYGSQGWHLEFADNSSNTATTLGKDTSGNGNNWTPNNLSVTAGAGNDSLVDVPTNGSQTDTGVGGEVRGNYCTLNPLKTTFSGDGGLPSHSNGNLDVTGSGGTSNTVGTIGVSSGKFYYEVTLTATHDSNACIFGLGQSATAYSNNFGLRPSGSFGGTIISGSAFTFGVGDTVGIAYEPGVSATFYKNNNASSFVASLSSGIWFPWAQLGGTTVSAVYNFGQRPFVNQSVPSGFKALNTANLPAPLVTKPNTVFDTKLYTGNGSTQTISGLGFSPDLVWIKARSSAQTHSLTDVVRGASKQLFSNLTNAEGSETDQITAFNSDGFSLGANVAGTGGVNTSSVTYAAWTWDAGSSTVTNTQGSITSSVRANATAGFSVVTAGAGGYFGGSVGHGLSVTPEFIIMKDRNGTLGWRVYHKSTGNNFYFDLTTGAAINYGSNLWNVTSSVFGSSQVSGYTLAAYCWAPVSGYSSFGSYTGNGSTDGPFVFTGMRPRFLMIKRTDSAGSWYIMDTARDTYNYANLHLYPNASSAEAASSHYTDILSNGFKARGSATDLNGSGGTYIYAAFAESPLNYSRAR